MRGVVAFVTFQFWGKGGGGGSSKPPPEFDWTQTITEPWEYSLIISLLWANILLLALLDAFFHRTVPVRKFPLFIIILVGLCSEILQHGISFVLSFQIQTLQPEPSKGLYFLFLTSDAVNETFELCLIMLIASGWGVIFTRLRPIHRVILIAGTLIMAAFQFVINFTDKSFQGFAFWTVLLILLLVSIWFYVLNMIHTNHKFLHNRERLRSSSHSSLSLESPVALRSTTSRPPREVPFLATPTYLKTRLYRMYAYFVVFYILTQILSHAVLTTLIILTHGFTKTLFWVFAIPRDLLELLLYSCLCYLFRLREDNPYFPIPDRDYSHPDRDYPHTADDSEEGAIAL